MRCDALRPAIRSAARATVLVSLAAVGACGGGAGAPTQPPTPSPIPPAPSPSAEPTPNAACANLAPGPIVRYAISPREQVTDGTKDTMRVWARPNWDEVWCLDKDKTHRLDFNSNQRDADGKECCWREEPVWRIVEDPGSIVASHHALDGSSGFNHRVIVEPEGREGFFTVQAEVDGVRSHPWQSNSGYQQGPLKVMAMTAADIDELCTCIYKGNAQYEGARCKK